MRRPDASMDLLNVLRDTALEPEYGHAEPPKHPAAARFAVVVVTLVAGIAMAISAVLATASTPQNAQERSELISRIRQLQDQQAASRQQLAELEAEVARLRAEQPVDPTVLAAIKTLEPVVGAAAVSGPGIKIVVDDAPNATQSSQLVTDRDLRQLVNALWEAGAEAVSVNGHRLSVRTAIRSAGSAITVDYVSLVGPYVVEAIGNPKTLASEFADTPGAQWWSYLRLNYGISYETSNVSNIAMAADPGLDLSLAQPVK